MGWYEDDEFKKGQENAKQNKGTLGEIGDFGMDLIASDAYIAGYRSVMNDPNYTGESNNVTDDSAENNISDAYDSSVSVYSGSGGSGGGCGWSSGYSSYAPGYFNSSRKEGLGCGTIIFIIICIGFGISIIGSMLKPSHHVNTTENYRPQETPINNPNVSAPTNNYPPAPVIPKPLPVIVKNIFCTSIGSDSGPDNSTVINEIFYHPATSTVTFYLYISYKDAIPNKTKAIFNISDSLQIATNRAEQILDKVNGGFYFPIHVLGETNDGNYLVKVAIDNEYASKSYYIKIAKQIPKLEPTVNPEHLPSSTSNHGREELPDKRLSGKFSQHTLGDRTKRAMEDKAIAEETATKEREELQAIEDLKRKDAVVAKYKAEEERLSQGGVRLAIALQSMDPNDQIILNTVYEKNRSGQSSTWMNQNTNIEYSVTPSPAYKSRNDVSMWCREAEITSFIAGKTEKSSCVACRDRNGQWMANKNL